MSSYVILHVPKWLFGILLIVCSIYQLTVIYQRATEIETFFANTDTTLSPNLPYLSISAIMKCDFEGLEKMKRECGYNTSTLKPAESKTGALKKIRELMTRCPKGKTAICHCGLISVV